jgi:hypothetical protein
MEAVMKVPHAAKAVIACGVLYVLLSFFSWQRHSFGPAGVYAQTLWHGLGVIVALTALAYLGWELARALGVEVVYDGVTSALISAAGAGVLLFLNLIVFLTWGQYRTWAAWLGMLLALAIGGTATWRARSEGIELPGLGGRPSLGGGSFSLPSAASAPAPELPDAQPVEA